MRRLAACAVIAAAMIAGGVATADEPPIDAERLFELAADKVGSGDVREAVALLERVATDFPDSREAPEALFLAGELYEDRLDDATAAIASYKRITASYTDSRVAVAAGRRLETLEAMVGSEPGEAERLSAFLALRREGAELDPDEALRRGEALLAEGPNWSNAPRLRVWMAGVALRDGQRSRAEALYREAMKTDDPDIAYEAAMARAALARDRGGFDEARALVDAVDPGGIPGRIEAVREARDRIELARLRARINVVATAILYLVPLLFLGLIAWATRSPRRALRALWPPPIETIYMAPVGVVFSIASFTGHHGISVAVITVIVAGLLISWLAGASQRVLPPRRWRPALHATLAATAVLAACYVALHRNHLLDLIASTVRFGPDV